MERLTRIVAFVVLASAIGFICVRAENLPALAPLDGIYRTKGEENGKEYAGTAIIEEQGTSGTYIVRFIVGKSVVIGIGVRDDDRLAVAWGAKAIGCTLYRIKGRTLEGKWLVAGQEEASTETLRWIAPLDAEDRDERKMSEAR